MAEQVAGNDTDGQFLHFVIEQDLGQEDPLLNPPQNKNKQVFLLYEDVFRCGICSLEFSDICLFFKHKIKHTIGESLVKCELCKQVFPSSDVLTEHYRLHHQMEAFAEAPLLMLDEPVLSRSKRKSKLQSIEEINSERAQPILLMQDGQLELRSFEEGDLLETVKEEKEVKQEEVVEEEQIPNFQFLLVTEVVRGRTVVYDRQWMQCLHCRTKYRTKQMMMQHMREKHANVMHEPVIEDEIALAEKNGFKVTLTDMLAYETSTQNDGKVRKTKVQHKLEKQDVLGTYPCAQCDKVFNRLRYLRKHNETHRTEKKFVCDMCGKRFKSRSYLNVHKHVHKEKMNKFKCNQCSFTSSNNASIHIHRQVHSQGSVLCDICGFAYNDKSTLSKHKRVHDISRPFACTFPECRWRFNSETMCKAHIRAHTTEGKFRCSQCGYIFRHKHHLIRHEMNIHNIHRDKNTACETDSVIVEPHLTGMPLVVTSDGAPITYEASDMVTYQALLDSGQPSSEVDGIQIDPSAQEILITDGEIQF
ncbi:hypothetical protein CAPTEDRAFT_224454 [Capitella teleta]|uniref:C2H2-type domain-containing protein n=1 Tax=Capitella teleta TaxID=283909 RepID=R7TVV5_CAPTE|nr:hypothetical protein CAPTEDRAFT_224454 [Capitella teleta]|eukprot:ELT95140.1 hypothetical protein CAPTEDRAFT_224454 [Capitella teleta]